VREGPRSTVPAHLRGSNYAGAASLGHGDGYVYPHDDPRGWVDQRYLPEEVGDAVYWRASEHGEEPARDRWRRDASGD